MKKYPTHSELDLNQIADDIAQKWQKHATFEATLARKGAPKLQFYEGPPGANGRPGIHHLFARTLKDLFCRFKTMQGYHIERKAGWDTHGLPVELSVEKELGITKEEIGKKISLKAYNKACKKAVLRYQKEWESLTARIGYWLDLSDPYLTYAPEYIDIVWGLLERLYTKKLLYQGHAIQPYSPAAGTGLSSHELNQPGCYKPVKDLSIIGQFQVKGLPNTYLLAWTTTPWTLPANTALAIGHNIEYTSIETFNPYTHHPVRVILAKAAIPRYFDLKLQNQPLVPPRHPNGPLPWRIVEHYSGEDLIGWQYHPILPYIDPESDRAFQVVDAPFVNTTDGTGIVHIAPTFGTDDFNLAQQKNLPSITIQGENGEALPIVDRQGRYVDAITDFAGAYVKPDYAPDHIRNAPNYQTLDLQIAIKLKKENKAFQVASYTHSYPHCWRTHKPILYYPLQAWFIKTTAYKKRLVHLNKTIKWQPQTTGRGRFHQWLENVVDWNLSRDRFWGTPLPIWRTEDGTEELCIGSLQELRHQVLKSVALGYMKEPLPEDFDPHRPYVDDIIIVSPQGKKMYRQTDVIDVWFDSGAMPYAQTPDPDRVLLFPPKNFPANFIIEGIDQTRGWFFTLHVLSVLLYDRVSFRNVLSTGLVLDKEGNKMSKQLGNTIDPHLLLDQYGPDIIRWYFVANANPWDNVKFNPEQLQEVKRKFFGTLHNTYQFFALYANLDQFKSRKKFPALADATLLDRWILSRLQHLIKVCNQSYENYDPTPAARAIQHFVIDELSNWYVRLNRKRFWKTENDTHKKVAYETLKCCLVTLSHLAAPIAPFYMEHLYQNLVQKAPFASIHLQPFPIPRTPYKNKALEAQMEYAKIITTLVHSLRKKHRIKVRIPLPKMILPITKEFAQADIEALQEIILTETNVKKIEFVQETLGLVTKHLKPNFQRLGKKHGKDLKAIQEALASLSQEAIATFEAKGHHTLRLPTHKLPLQLADVIISTKDMEGWATASQHPITLALDINPSPALLIEGYAREIVNRIQNLRKEKQLQIEDKIALHVSTTSPPLQEAFHLHKAYILEETQAQHFDHQVDPQNAISLEIEKHTLQLSFEPLPK